MQFVYGVVCIYEKFPAIMGVITLTHLSGGIMPVRGGRLKNTRAVTACKFLNSLPTEYYVLP